MPEPSGQAAGEPRVHLTLFGPFEVRRGAGLVTAFRSRSARALLAYVALHAGSSVDKLGPMEAIWPDSEYEQQAQNLRRAVADVRAVLDAEGGRTALRFHDGRLELDPDLVASDVAAFSAADAAEAVALYRGPLLEDMNELWVLPEREAREGEFARHVQRRVERLVENGGVDDALALARRAVRLAPTREAAHIALIRAYAAAGLNSEALAQYESLERMLDEAWGEGPSRDAVQAIESMPRASRPSVSDQPDVEAPARVAHAPVRIATAPGGAMPLDSPTYVLRVSDEAARRALSEREGMILLKGGRQIGKSSLLVRLMAQAEAGGSRVLHTDFQTLSEELFEDAGSLYRAILHLLARQAGVDLATGFEWVDWLGPNSNLEAGMETILQSVEGPALWAVDEVDRVLHRPYTGDFFGLLRSWFNRRAHDQVGVWSRLQIALAYSFEPVLFVTDINQSPFNVGVRVELPRFGAAQVEEVARRYGLSLPAPDVKTVLDSTGGLPYLAQRFLAAHTEGTSTEELAARAALEDGPLGDVLRRAYLLVSRDPELAGECRRMLCAGPVVSLEAPYRLEGMGIAFPNPDGSHSIPARAMAEYLAARLG